MAILLLSATLNFRDRLGDAIIGVGIVIVAGDGSLATQIRYSELIEERRRFGDRNQVVGRVVQAPLSVTVRLTV